MEGAKLRKELGKIQDVRFGYNDFLFGLFLDIGGDSWGVTESVCYNPKFHGDNSDHISNMLKEIRKLIEDAKVETVDQLKNIPVECSFDGNFLKEVRILKEVL